MSTTSNMSPLSSPTPSISSTCRPRRHSKFVEGAAVVGPELLQRTDTTQEHFNTILAMEDAMAASRREHRDSQSSESSAPKIFSLPRFSLDERPKAIAQLEEDADRMVEKVKGRLRSLTAGGKRREMQPYPGT